MKRKKWSELEEQTLISKYSDLLKTNTLQKLKTREKKFKPIAEYVNSLHHNLDPITFPFKWSWRDVSIKVQNMRHQYLNVKQKIKVCGNNFNWEDGLIHWDNFLQYKHVFGDVELSSNCSNNNNNNCSNGNNNCNNEEEEFEFDGSDEEEENEEENDVEKTSLRKVLELREMIVRREERKREREEDEAWGIEEMRVEWGKREVERRRRMEREFEEERKRKMRLEEKWEKEEMEWRERMVEMEMEHERRVMRMQADACQNQLQIIGVVGRVLCQFFGSGNDGLGLGTTQVLQQETGGLAENGKADGSLPSQFL